MFACEEQSTEEFELRLCFGLRAPDGRLTRGDPEETTLQIQSTTFPSFRMAAASSGFAFGCADTIPSACTRIPIPTGCFLMQTQSCRRVYRGPSFYSNG